MLAIFVHSRERLVHAGGCFLFTHLSSPLGRSTDFIPEYSIRQAKLPHCLDRAPKPAFDPRPARGPLVRIECRLVICEGVDNHARALVRGLAGERAMIAERRSEEHTSELQSLMRKSYAVFCLKKK